MNNDKPVNNLYKKKSKSSAPFNMKVIRKNINFLIKARRFEDNNSIRRALLPGNKYI